MAPHLRVRSALFGAFSTELAVPPAGSAGNHYTFLTNLRANHLLTDECLADQQSWGNQTRFRILLDNCRLSTGEMQKANNYRR